MALFQPEIFHFDNIKTFDVWEWVNLVRIDNLCNLNDPVEPFDCPELEAVSEKILEARKNGKPVIPQAHRHN